MHIAVEGFDGVGKSTAAKKLAEILGFMLVEKPLHYLFDIEGNEQYIRIRDAVNKSKNKQFTGWFYGLGNIYLYERFKGKNIITDRHILSNYCWSGAPETDYIFDAIYNTVGAPDFTFLIENRIIIGYDKSGRIFIKEGGKNHEKNEENTVAGIDAGDGARLLCGNGSFSFRSAWRDGRRN